jgi:hypothetical protein
MYSPHLFGNLFEMFETCFFFNQIDENYYELLLINTYKKLNNTKRSFFSLNAFVLFGKLVCYRNIRLSLFLVCIIEYEQFSIIS